MNTNKNEVILLSVLFLMYSWGCGSSDNEIERTDISDSTAIAGNNEIKNEIEKQKPEIIEEFLRQETTVISQPPAAKYTVQLGAYEVESNAMDMLNNAKIHFGTDVYYDLKGTLYKIRVGKLNSIDEALVLISKIQNAGFLDAFITELGK